MTLSVQELPVIPCNCTYSWLGSTEIVDLFTFTILHLNYKKNSVFQSELAIPGTLGERMDIIYFGGKLCLESHIFTDTGIPSKHDTINQCWFNVGSAS